MTVFGRDTAITSLQTLLLGPEIAVGALEALAELQAREEDPSIDAEPGKIVHEMREGRCAETWFPRYYGSVDSTPLFLVLLAETWRWTDDASLARRLREPGHGALSGSTATAITTRTGSSSTAAWRPAGSRTSPGRTRVTRSASRTAPSPRRRSRPSRCRATCTTRSAGLRSSPARCGAKPDLADVLEHQAEALRSRFDEAFWVDERGGFYALALDGKKKPVDSRCSNMGHLLWSGIVPPERVPQVVDQLLSEELWTGWGIRTMASDAAAFNPISYHNGTVWPHDTALAAWGLARHGYTAEARRVGRALIEAAGHFDWSLPEVFAGYARDDTPFPIAYPTAARPQAWAAGTPILLVRVLLGIEPDRRRQRLVTTVADELPSWLEGLRIEGVRAYGQDVDDRGRGRACNDCRGCVTTTLVSSSDAPAKRAPLGMFAIGIRVSESRSCETKS